MKLEDELNCLGVVRRRPAERTKPIQPNPTPPSQHKGIWYAPGEDPPH